MIDDMRQVVRLTLEQTERLIRGEAVEIVPAKENHQIVLDVDQDALLTAKYVLVGSEPET